MSDQIAEFKAKQRAGWPHFAALEMLTISPAARLVRFAAVKPGQTVLDVGCGTGVVAITARRLGTKVTGLDLTPELLARAKEHGGVEGYEDVKWKEGDAEELPFADGEFDVVLSQFGHMFAPRADVAAKEMLRVLRKGGTLAFSTWPPDHMIGRLFALVGKHAPSPPPGVTPPPVWGDAAFIRERLGDGVRDLTFDRETLLVPTMSPRHYRQLMERTSAPVIKIVESLRSDQAKLAQFRREMDALIETYYDSEHNVVRQSYLMTRAVKA